MLSYDARYLKLSRIVCSLHSKCLIFMYVLAVVYEASVKCIQNSLRLPFLQLLTRSRIHLNTPATSIFNKMCFTFLKLSCQLIHKTASHMCIPRVYPNFISIFNLNMMFGDTLKCGVLKCLMTCRVFAICCLKYY